MHRALISRAALTLLSFAGGCFDGEGQQGGAAPGEPVFPADLEAYREARPCAFSHDHELIFVRVLADPLAYDTYTRFEEPYPVGATIVKLSYDDEECTDLVDYTAMKKLATGQNPEGGDWWWQRVALDRSVVEEGAPVSCLDCHREHCSPPYGYDLTCKPEASEF